LNTAVDCDDGNPILRDEASHALALWIRRLRAIAKTGIAKGEIRKDADPEQIATVIVSTLEGALMMARLQRSERPLQYAREHLEDFLDQQDAGRGRPARASASALNR